MAQFSSPKQVINCILPFFFFATSGGALEAIFNLVFCYTASPSTISHSSELWEEVGDAEAAAETFTHLSAIRPSALSLPSKFRKAQITTVYKHDINI